MRRPSSPFDGIRPDECFRFHDRISRTYRREKWREILDPILQLSYDSAVKVGDDESALKALFELLAPGSSSFRINIPVSDPFSLLRFPHLGRAEGGLRRKPAGDAQGASSSLPPPNSLLTSLLQTKTPATPENSNITIDLADAAPLRAHFSLSASSPLTVSVAVDCQIVFWKPTSDVGAPVPFQLSLASPPTARASSLVFSKLQIQFNDGRPPVVVSNAEPSDSEGVVRYHALGEMGDGSAGIEEVEVPLVWRDGSTKVFMGTVAAASELGLTVSLLSAWVGA